MQFYGSFQLKFFMIFRYAVIQNRKFANHILDDPKIQKIDKIHKYWYNFFAKIEKIEK